MYTACVAPGCTTEEPCSESCSGTELTYCYGGVPVTLDCTDYGFKYCLEGTLSSDDTFPIAYCAFPDGAPDRICEVEDTDTACGACAKEQCCAEWTTCVDDTDCVDYLTCTSDCAGVSTCIADCGDANPAGLAVYQDFSDCRQAGCPVCGG